MYFLRYHFTESLFIYYRTKVIAQRKFAQGQSAASSAYLNYVPVSTSATPVKETKEPPNTPTVELIPNTRPNTEDFLTYLCFRGTSALPPNLDFFNNRPSTSSPAASIQNKTKKADDSQSLELQNENSNAGDPSDNDGDDEDKKSDQKQNYGSFAVRKRAEQFSDAKLEKKRRQAQAVEALRKKYHDQRMAKLRATAFNRQARAGGIRTRSSPFFPSSSNKIVSTNDGTGNSSITESNSKKAQIAEEMIEAVPDKVSVTKIVPPSKAKKNKKVTKNQVNTIKPGTRSSASKYDAEEIENPSPKSSKLVKDSKKESKTSMAMETAESEKIDHPKVENPKRTTRLSALRNSQLSPILEISEQATEKVNKSLDIEFSSDDDVPLVKAVVKKAVGKQEKKGKTIPNSKIKKRLLTVARAQSATTLKSEVSSKKFEGTVKSKSATNVAKTGTPPIDVEPEKPTKKKNKNKVDSPATETRDLSQTTECSENEGRVARPSRKTKEAATIYMELIGRRLNLKDLSDDDASSLDSLELPNFRKMEQIEKECKQANDKKEVQCVPAATAPPLKKVKLTNSKTKIKNAGRAMKQKKAVEKTPALDKTPAIEKSFSDSDEEPLAKIQSKKIKPLLGKRAHRLPQLKKKKSYSRTKISMTDTNIAPVFRKIDKMEEPEKKEVITKKDIISEPVAVKKTVAPEPTIEPIHKTQTDEMDSINVNKSGGDSPMKNLNYSFESGVSKFKDSIPFNRSVKLVAEITPERGDHLALLEISVPPKTSTPVTKSLLGNLLPSKEESEKIFGIASVTLAQCSGPDDTKCTLGKCGAIHKPTLHPPVLTESVLGGHLPKDRRKTKVNMTHEQIQKWVDETSWSPVPDDAKLDEVWPPAVALGIDNSLDHERGSNKSSKTNNSKNKATTSSNANPNATVTRVSRTKSIKPEKAETLSSHSRSVAREKISPKLVTPPASISSPVEVQSESLSKMNSQPIKIEENVNSGKIMKGPNKASTSKSKISLDRKPIYNQRRQPVYKQNITPPKTSYRQSKVPNTFGAFSPENEHSIYSFDKEDDELPVAAPYRRHSRNNSRSEDTKDFNIKDCKESKELNDDETFQKPQMQSTPVKQPIMQSQQVSLTLSPEDNTKTVQVPNDDDRSNAETNSDNNASDAKCKTVGNKMKKTVNKNVNISSGDGNDSDNDGGHTFYIPLQGANITGNKSDQLIQGVAVKLGTEGPEGPNQRVIMHAKLVTKAQMGANTQPIPESMANVHELVKTLINSSTAQAVCTTATTMTAATNVATTPTATVSAVMTPSVPVVGTSSGTSKDGASKYVPIGTVQPRFKSTDDETKVTTNTTDANIAPESLALQSPDLGTLSRFNSNSSLTSQKNKAAKVKNKIEPPIQPSNNTVFPRRDDPAQMVEAPVFRPTEKEFQDPIEYIDRIAPIASRFGICKIIPPPSFKPECRVSDDMRFTAQNQYIHKMLHRWGPSAKELSAIRKYLATQSIHFQLPPLIGGMEVDLPRLYHTVQELGGLKEVIEKKKWPRVAEDMCIPKAAHDRVTKLDDIYCKYLLPYDTLSPVERQKLFEEVEAEWAKKEAKARRTADKYISMENGCNGEDSEDEENDDDDESEEDDTGSMECIVKGRSMPLNQFFRIARNTMSLWFKNTEPTAAEIESEFWRHVAVRDSHVCVHSGSIDSSGWGYGFPTPGPKTKGSACSKHPWNLKVLTNSSGSILRSLGPVIGITVPTLHVGMLFSACCWYRDPHGLPWIEYLHTGASKLWYGVPDDQNSNFRKALTALVPTHCQNKTIWLPSDTAMVPPHMLTDKNVSLCRTEQEPGQYVVVFPHAYTSSLCSGYTVSESVYFATNSWLDTAKEDFYVSKIHFHF